MTHENPDSQAARPMAAQDKVSARRRLIKGSFAAPAAMALCSGSALAAGSATCISKMNGTPVSDPNATDTSTTGFWRVQVYRSTVGTADWIRGQDVATLNGAGKTPYMGNSQFQKLTLGSTSGPAVGSILPASPGVTGTLTALSSWVAVRVDSGGNIIGIQSIMTPANVSNSSPMTASCWTSVRP